MVKYGNDFYKNNIGPSTSSAEEIVPEIIGILNPSSVVDVGCGVGTWLKVFKKFKKEVFGIDFNVADKKLFLIKKTEFKKCDLRAPINLKKRFDLAISLEVAEHIDIKFADTFLDSLTSLSDKIIFSAAIPFQGGYDHINEQWPDYWLKKFEKRGYVLVDCFRSKFWNNPRVDYYYSQNMFLYCKKEVLQKNKILQEFYKNTNRDLLKIVHPIGYVMKGKSLEKIKKYLPLKGLLRKIFIS